MMQNYCFCKIKKKVQEDLETMFLEMKASKGLFVLKKITIYPYIRAENSSTGCASFVKCFDISVFGLF